MPAPQFRGAALLISVVIPVYNGARFIAAAIESVRAQTHPVAEVIVVDDGSTDDSGDVARRAGATVIRRERAGIGAARNAGLEATTGDVIAFLDADDLWPPEKNAVQMARLEEEPGVGIVAGQVVQFRGDPPDTVDGLERQPGYVAGAVLVRRSVFKQVGVFDPRYRLGEFIDWWARANDAGVRVATLDEVVLLRRLHDANTGLRDADKRVDYARLARAALARRRASGAGE